MSIIKPVIGRPGSSCKKLFARMGATTKPGRCRCNEIADEMDSLGPEGCKQERNRLVKELKLSSQEWFDDPDNKSKLKFLRIPAKTLMGRLVDRCIREAMGQKTIGDKLLDLFLDTFFPYEDGASNKELQPAEQTGEVDPLEADPFYWAARRDKRVKIRLVR